MTVRISKPAFNVREKLSQLEGRVPFERMPVGSVMLIGRNFADNITNVSSNDSWTNIVGADITVFPRLQSSLLEIEMVFSMEAQDYVNGIGFRIWRSRIRSDALGMNTNKIYDNYQHSHWGSGMGQWGGPGQIVLKVYDKPYNMTGIHDADYGGLDVSNRGEGIRYYMQAYKERGNNLYVNYGQDEEGLITTVKEIRQ
tara:strand:+ start:4121 stop:4714 length:594 start_codon:yes stop_codon:yes gene_type:complete